MACSGVNFIFTFTLLHCRGKRFFSFPKRPERRWGPRSHLCYGHSGSFQGVKQPGREVNHPPPPTAEGKNEWSHNSSFPIRLHGVDRENFTFQYQNNKKCRYMTVSEINCFRIVRVLSPRFKALAYPHRRPINLLKTTGYVMQQQV